jgi:hypothetical protein
MTDRIARVATSERIAAATEEFSQTARGSVRSAGTALDELAHDLPASPLSAGTRRG